MRFVDSLAEVEQKEKKELADILIKSFQSVGILKGMGQVEVEACEIVSPEREVAFHSVRFTITSSGDYPTQQVAAVPIAEVDRLIAGVDKLVSARLTSDRFKLTEIDTSIEDLKVTVFNNENGKVHGAISANGCSCHLMSQMQLQDLKRLIVAARDHLERVMVR